jgi:hypothetical protein
MCGFYYYIILSFRPVLTRLTSYSQHGSGITLSHPDLRGNPNARIHVRQDQVTHMHRLSEYQKHSVNHKEVLNIYYMTECLNLTTDRVANSRKETHVEVLHRQLTGERAPRTHQTL